MGRRGGMPREAVMGEERAAVTSFSSNAASPSGRNISWIGRISSPEFIQGEEN